MSNIISAIEKEQLKQNLPEISAGDTVIVKVKVKEGERTRLQAFEGVVIAVKNRGLNSAFTVRKMSHGEGVERTFQTHSKLIDSIEVKRKGDVRKSKIYYLRGRTGKAARIKEKLQQKKEALIKESVEEAATVEAAEKAQADAAKDKAAEDKVDEATSAKTKAPATEATSTTETTTTAAATKDEASKATSEATKDKDESKKD